MRAAALACILVVAAAPHAFAAEDSRLILESAAPVALAGSFAASLDEPVARIRIEKAAGFAEIRGVFGELSFESWRQAHTRVHSVEQTTLLDEPQEETILLVNATLRVDLVDETFLVRIVGGPGSVGTVRGVPDGAPGRPTFLDRDVSPRPLPIPSPPTFPPDDVAWAWRAGWAFLGDITVGTPISGFPLLEDARLSVAGPATVQLFGGNLTIIQDSGILDRRLGAWSTGGLDEGALLVGAREETIRRAILRGEIADADLPLSDQWGVAGPAIRWDVAGEIAWERADGTLRHGAGSARAEGERVVVRGATGAALTKLATGGARERYVAEGAWESVTIGGRPVEAPATGAGSVATGLTILGALAAILVALSDLGRLTLARFAALLYARIPDSALLDHPGRQRILQLVRERPRIHMRELQRAVGGARGPFLFHLARLERAGYLVLRREGKYTAIYAPEAEPSLAPRHAVARRILDALPSDGSMRLLSEVARDIGISRQLAAHHVRGMEKLGIVKRADGRVGRGAAHAATERSARGET